jgi:thiol-disulfide isomerase/thioredoxin
MKKITLLIAALIISSLSYSQVNNYSVGDVVNDFTLTDTDGNIHNLYSITAEGKYVFLDFFFDTCPPCQTTTPIFNEFHDKYGCNEGDIFCLSVNNGSDNDQQVILFEQTYGGPFNHAPAVSADGGAGAVDDDFGIVAYPTYCVINPDNEIIVLDIWPISGVATFENALPTGVDPTPMECTVLAIEEAIFMDSIVIAPNPVSSQGTLSIALPEAIPTSLTIFDILGKRVYENSFDSDRISVPVNMDAGTYIVKLETTYGVTSKPIIVK